MCCFAFLPLVSSYMMLVVGAGTNSSVCRNAWLVSGTNSSVCRNARLDSESKSSFCRNAWLVSDTKPSVCRTRVCCSHNVSIDYSLLGG